MTIKEKTITRTISIQYDINTNISYQDFRKNKDYQSRIQIIDNCFVLADGHHYFSSLFPLSLVLNIAIALNIDVCSKMYILGKMLHFDIKETFSGPIDIIENIKYLRRSNFTEMDFLDFIQSVFVDKDKLAVPSFGNEYEYKQLLNEAHWENESYKSLMDAIFGEVTYKYEFVDNKSLDYIIFQILIQREDLFLVYARPHSVVVCTASNLYKHFSKPNVVSNITKLLYEELPKDIYDQLADLKRQYMEGDLLEVYFRKIREQFIDTKNIELSVVSKEKFSLERWKEFEESYPTSCISETTYKVYMGKAREKIKYVWVV